MAKRKIVTKTTKRLNFEAVSGVINIGHLNVSIRDINTRNETAARLLNIFSLEPYVYSTEDLSKITGLKNDKISSAISYFFLSSSLVCGNTQKLQSGSNAANKHFEVLTENKHIFDELVKDLEKTETMIDDEITLKSLFEKKELIFFKL